jgi:hypothetical protein
VNAEALFSYRLIQQSAQFRQLGILAREFPRDFTLAQLAPLRSV